jgi:hypothetical protein
MSVHVGDVPLLFLLVPLRTFLLFHEWSLRDGAVILWIIKLLFPASLHISDQMSSHGCVLCPGGVAALLGSQAVQGFPHHRRCLHIPGSSPILSLLTTPEGT